MLTDEQLALARRLWADGVATFEICLQLRVSADVFKARRRDQLRDLPRRSRSEMSARRGEDPGEDEIARECERIRATWDWQQFIDRRV
jgi:hypothetical protein